MKNPPELITAQAILAMPGQLKIHELNPNAVRLIKSLGDAAGLEHIGVHLVEKGQQILIRLCHTIEREVPRGLNELYPLTHMAVIAFNDLAIEFEDAGSQIETAAREAIGAAFASIASAYGFAADGEELIANRDW